MLEALGFPCGFLVPSLGEVKSCKRAMEWLHRELRIPPVQQFNETLANSYKCSEDQHVPEHTDDNELLGDPTVVVSLSAGPALGLYCWQPNDRSDSSVYAGKFGGVSVNQQKRIDRMIEQGLRGRRSAFPCVQLIMNPDVCFYMLVLPTTQFPNEARSPFVVLWRCGVGSAM